MKYRKTIAALSILANIIWPFGFDVPVAHAAAPMDYVSCWEMDETSGTRADAAANSNDLSETNTVSYGTGKQGNAADIEDNTNEYLSISDAAQTGLDITDDFTLTGWFNLESFGTYTNNFFSKYQSTGNQRAYYFNYNTESSLNKLEVGVSDNGSTGSSNFCLFRSDSANLLSTATWHYVSFTFDMDTLTGRFYVDGSYVATSELGSCAGLDGTIFDNSESFKIGAHTNITYHNYDGLVDIAEVYNRTLSDAEITALYNSGSGVSCTSRSGGGSTRRIITTN